MSTRPVTRILLLVGIALVIAFLVFVAVAAPQATDVGLLLIYSGLGMIAGFAGVAFLVWTVFVIIGAIRLRDRRPGTRILWFIASAVVGASVNILLIASFSAGADGWGGLIIGIAITGGAVFVLSASAATLLVELLILRRDRSAVPSAS